MDSTILPQLKNIISNFCFLLGNFFKEKFASLTILYLAIDSFVRGWLHNVA